MEEVVRTQVAEGLAGFTAARLRPLVIAYEPVWAIGTGRNATPEQAQEVHAFIRGLLPTIVAGFEGETVPILYGGSVKPENIGVLMRGADIDGALVGGASLKADSFAGIIKGAAASLRSNNATKETRK